MKLTISVDSSGELVNVDVPGSLSLDDFKAYLQAETDIEPNNQVLKHNSKTFDDSSKTLEDSDVKDGDLIVLSKIRGGSGSNPNPTTAGQINSQIEFMRQQFLNDPQAGEQLRRSNPQMHSILNDPQSFQNAMQNQLEQFQSGLSPHVMSQNQRDELTRLQANPDDPESQARILEIIRQEQIDDNMKLAYELTPETFASVSMLYVNININGEKVQAFVDSGAQATIISPRLAERVGISRLIDRRFQGEARGVGSQTIEGKIHSVPISIGNSDIHIPCSFMVIDTQVDLLFGLDMLRRHRCVIDLVRDVLIVGGNIEAKFLKESEIESNAFGAGLGGTRKAGASHFGGNIFSDIPSANTRSSPSITASSAAGEAAKKRHNSGENNKKFKEEDVKSLIDLGFTKEEALFALEQTKGNVEQAAALLFQ